MQKWANGMNIYFMVSFMSEENERNINEKITLCIHQILGQMDGLIDKDAVFKK